MSLNCNEIDLILKELDLDGSFIQDIIQPGFDTICFYTYKVQNAKTVLICTSQNAVRINETRRKIVKNEKPLRFMEFLKSKIKGARINCVNQIGKSRIIKFSLSHCDSEYFLYARLWSNASNVILCDKNNVILDSMFRRPQKNEVTGGIFVIPEQSENSEKVWPVRDFSMIQKEYDESNSFKKILSFNEKVDIWYSEHSSSLSRASLLLQAEKWYTSVKSRMEKALFRLEEKLKDFKNADKYRHQGDLILSYSNLFPVSSKFLNCEDYENGKSVQILIDPEKNPYENAQVYYEKYKKAKSGLDELLHDIELSKKQIQKIDSLYSEIINEENPIKMEQLLRKDLKPKQQIKKNHPGLSYDVNGWYIIVGRDANENDELLRHHVKGSDLWLHTRDYPGGYVFIKNRPGKTVPLDILLDAGNLAVYYSKARSSGKADLYYTHVKYLRRIKDGPKGLVSVTQEKNLFVTLDKDRLKKLDAIRHEADGL